MLLTRLKYWREQRGLSLRELAVKSKVPYSAIWLLENGKREPQGRTTRKLAQALDVEVTELYTEALAAQETAQPANDNKIITSVISPARTRAKRAKLTGLWVGVEAGHVYLARDQEAAGHLKAQFGRVRVYQADSWKEAAEAHRAFLAREKMGREAW